MPTKATVKLISLRNCLVNLPLTLYSQLSEKGVAPQNLVVELSWQGPSKQKLSVGWTGMPARIVGLRSARVQGTSVENIELDAQFAKQVNLTDGQQVTIDLRMATPVATSISISPLSVDDWEILEVNADFVEQHLLSQVRAAATGQNICVWTGQSKTMMRFVVDSVSPDKDTVRLTTDTEVIVAPKTRRPNVMPSEEISMPKDPAAHIANELRNCLFRLLPLELLDIINSQNILTKHSIAVTPQLYTILSSTYPSLSCPVILQHLHQPKRAPQKPKPTANRKNKSHGSQSESEEPSKPLPKESRVDKVAFHPVKGLPDGHVWLSKDVREDLGMSEAVESKDRWENDYKLIRFGETRSSKVQSHSDAKNIDSPLASPDIPLPSVSEDSKRLGAKLEPDAAPLAGVQDVMNKTITYLQRSLLCFDQGTPCLGLLLCGSSGSGKTSLAKAIAAKLAREPSTLTYVQYIDCSAFSEERIPPLKEKLQEWLDEACWRAPSIVIFDNLDRMIPGEVEHIDSFRSLQIANLFVMACQKALSSRPVSIMATAQNQTSLHALLTSSHLLGERINLLPPNKSARKEILAAMIESKIQRTQALIAPGLDYTSLATQTDGYLPADLRDLADRAVYEASMNRSASETLRLEMKHFVAAQKEFVPISLKDVKLQKSEVQWADIGGLHEARRILRETLEWPTKYAAIFAKCPLRLRSGILLYGFPGCGKTLLASAVAKECGLNFISVKGPELLNKYIGASEKSVRDIFERAQAAKPCVLFFDEFDSIAPKRGHDSTGVTDRVVNQMLTQMDGAEGLEGVYVLAATSRPDLIDPALLRPGRLDKSLLCDMPSASDRKEILAACSRKMAFEPDVDLSELVEQTDGYSGADLQGLVYNAHLEAVHSSINVVSAESSSTPIDTDRAVDFVTHNTDVGASAVLSLAERNAQNKRLRQILDSVGSTSLASRSIARVDQSPTLVTSEHLDKALQDTRPSVPRDELARLQRIYREFVSGRSENGLPSGDASSSIGGRASLM